MEWSLLPIHCFPGMWNIHPLYVINEIYGMFLKCRANIWWTSIAGSYWMKHMQFVFIVHNEKNPSERLYPTSTLWQDYWNIYIIFGAISSLDPLYSKYAKLLASKILLQRCSRRFLLLLAGGKPFPSFFFMVQLDPPTMLKRPLLL